MREGGSGDRPPFWYLGVHIHEKAYIHMKKFLKRLALFTTGFYLGGSFVVFVDLYQMCGFDPAMFYYVAIWPYSAMLFLLN